VLADLVSVLASCDISDFKYGSLMVFGNVHEQLYELAKAVLTVIESITQPERQEPEDDFLDAKAFAQLAEEEISFLQQQSAGFKTSVRVRDDIAGVMV